MSHHQENFDPQSPVLGTWYSVFCIQCFMRYVLYTLYCYSVLVFPFLSVCQTCRVRAFLTPWYVPSHVPVYSASRACLQMTPPCLIGLRSHCGFMYHMSRLGAPDIFMLTCIYGPLLPERCSDRSYNQGTLYFSSPP